MNVKKIIIAGGGLTGLSAAWRLEELKRPYLLFEKDREVGGLCCSQKVGGFIFDRGGHVLHFRDPGTLALVKKFLGTNIMRHERKALFYAFGRYGRYPFQAHLGSMPKKIVRECLAGAALASGKAPGHHEDNGDFRSWVRGHFGDGLGRHFFFPYNAKFWKVPLRDLTSEWARHVIPVPTYEEIVSGAQNKNSRSWGYNATFWYPRRGGIQELPLAMASGLKHVVTGCALESIDAEKKEVIVATGAKEKFDRLITTIPLPELMRLIKNIPASVRRSFSLLRWNAILNVNLGVEGEIAPAGHWIYFPQKTISFFRAGLPHRISRSLVPRGMSALSLEIAYAPGQAPDLKRLFDRAIGDSKEAGLIASGQRVSFVDALDIAYGYPVYDHHYLRAKEVIASFLGKHHIIPAGRYGAWRYMSMEDALLEGRALAEVS
jgi:protoporphyrinogen oxidase